MKFTLPEEDRIVMNKAREHRNEWWRLLRILKDEYSQAVNDVAGQFDVDTFDVFIERNFGVKINYDQQGNITGDYDIVDKNKHLLLLMKHGK